MKQEFEVLEANERFYRALAAQDADAMDALWAQHAPVACIHPGWDALNGRAAVVGSFRAILESGGAPQIRITAATAHVLGEAAFVTCHEVISGARLVATNVFVREDGAWRMVHHHSSSMAPGQVRAHRPEPEMRS
jgi:ketosteroid isomerase-like protein